MASILIFDSMPAQAHKILANMPLTLAFVPTTAQLWQALPRLQPDIVICDISAGDASGSVIAEKCRELAPGARLLLTGPPICRLQSMRLIEQGLVAGFLSKPWQVGAVIDAIRSMLPDAVAYVRAAGKQALRRAAREPGARPQAQRQGSGEGGRYRLDELIGEGGSGRVYRAHDLLLDMPVAIKLLHEFLYGDPQALGELQSEARVCMTLAHPHIVRLYNLEKRGGHYFLIMEYIDGPSLGHVLAQNPEQDTAFVSGVVNAVAEALEHAHEAGVVHSDLTPANILFTGTGIPKLIDFGIASLVNQRAAPGEFIAGTPAYMSPEQLRGEKVGPAGDIFAFGVVAYQMLSGYLPQTADATLEDLAFRPRPELAGHGDAVAATISRALAFNPADRWPCAADFAAALLQALAGQGERRTENANRQQPPAANQ